MTATMGAPSTTGLVSFPPPLPQNAYQRLLYEALEPEGFRVVDGHFKVGWMLRNRRRARVLHFHWPQEYYRYPPKPSSPLTLVKLGLFAVRLAAARALGYRVAWTIHEVYPLKTHNRRHDRIAASLLARFASVLFANDEQTAAQARRDLGSRAANTAVVPHSSYIGVYPEGRSRAEVRAELGIPEDAVAFILFGHISVYKRIEWFVDAFRAADAPNAVLLVAGLVMDEAAGEHIRRASAEDDRVKALLEFIADERVAELFGACDVAISPRQDGGTSGAIVLSSSLGLPAVAASVPTYEALTGGEDAAWLFEPDDADSLKAALRRAASDTGAIRDKGERARGRVAHLTWEGMAARTAQLLRASMNGSTNGHAAAGADAT